MPIAVLDRVLARPGHTVAMVTSAAHSNTRPLSSYSVESTDSCFDAAQIILRRHVVAMVFGAESAAPTSLINRVAAGASVLHVHGGTDGPSKFRTARSHLARPDKWEEGRRSEPPEATR